MSSSSMSAGTKYYISKYKLAHESVTRPDSKACECEVKAIEELMAAPYKTFRATKAARKELKGLKDITEEDAGFCGELLHKRRKELKNKEEKEEETAGVAAHKCRTRQQPPKVILHVKNSPFRLSQSSESESKTAFPADLTTNDGANDYKGEQTSAKPKIILKLRQMQIPEKTATSTTVQTSTANNEEVKTTSQTIKLNISNSTLSRSKSPGTGQPGKCPVRIRLRINDSSTQAPIQAPAQQQQKHNRLKRKYESLFDLDSAAKRQHSESCKLAPFHKITNPFIAGHYKYVNEKPTSICEGTTIHDDMPTMQMVTRGATKRSEPEEIRKIILQPPKKDDPLRFGTSEFIRDQEIVDDLEAIKASMKQEANARDLQEEPKAMAPHPILEAIMARMKEQVNFRDLQEKLKAMARHHDSEESPNHEVYSKMKAEQAKREANTEEAKEIMAECEQEVELIHQEPANDAFEAITNDRKILDEPKNLGIFETEKKAMRAYKEAERCAKLAKQTVEAKQKLVAIARELETIDKKIGPDPNGPQLSAIPAHIRMLIVPAKPSTGRSLTGFAIRTNRDFPNKYINTTPRKPSNLRHELVASLADKQAAEAAKQKAQEEEKQRVELQAEKNRLRQKNAQRNLDKFLDTGAMPSGSDEGVRKDFHQALKQWYATDEGKRQMEGEEYAERMAREQAAAHLQAHVGGVRMQRLPTDEGYSSMRSAPTGEEEDKMDGMEMAAMNYDCPATRKQ